LNLLPFVLVLDWAEGLSAFQTAGDISLIAGIFRQNEPDFQSKKGERPEDFNPVKKMRRASRYITTNLEKFASALDFLRPMASINQSHSLNTDIDKAIASVQDVPPIKAFFDKLKAETTQFAHPDGNKNTENILKKQGYLIRWLASKSRLSDALIMTREWLVSWLMFQSKASYQEIFQDTNFTRDMGGPKPREVTENALNNANHARRLGQSKQSESDKNDFDAHIQKIVDLWGRVVEIRNDLAHVGYLKAPMDLDSLRSKIGGDKTELGLIKEIFGDDTQPGRVNLETLEIKPAEKKPAEDKTDTPPTEGQDAQ
jgi:hypothetical protein